MKDPNQYYSSQISELIELVKTNYRLEITSPHKNFNWLSFHSLNNPLIVSQGWKIHITFRWDEIPVLFKRIIPILIQRNANFKIPLTLENLVYLNSGMGGDTQIGKSVTVYPNDSCELEELVKILSQNWKKSKAPSPSSNLLINTDGAVSIRYGVFSGAQKYHDSTGMPHYALIKPDGQLTPDIRSSNGSQPDWVPALPFQTFYNDSAIPTRLKLPKQSVHLLMNLQSRRFVKVYYGFDIDNNRACIIKYVPSKSFMDLGGYDDCAKLKNEFITQKIAFEKKKITAIPYTFKKNKNGSFLISEFLEGDMYIQLPFEKQINLLPKLIETIHKLHDCAIVHRDLKLSNFIYKNGKINVIDFELAHGSNLPLFKSHGTRNFMPPEAQDGISNISYDIFSLGAVIQHVALRKDPATLPERRDQRIGLMYLYGQKKLAETVKQCQQSDSKLRPSAITLKKLVQRSPFNYQLPEFKSYQQSKTKRWIFRMVQDAAFATRHFKQEIGEVNAWKNNHIASNFLCEGINIGASGIVLGLLNIVQSTRTRQFDRDIRGGADWIMSQDTEHIPIGLFTGLAGMAIALGATGVYFNESLYLERAHLLLAQSVTSFNNMTPTDWFIGLAGILDAGCILYDITADTKYLNTVSEAGNYLLHNYTVSNGVIVWNKFINNDLENEFIVGSAHGSAGIAMALVKYGQRTNNEMYLELGRKTLISIYKNARNKKRTALLHRADSTQQSAGNASWCHGSAGYLWCILECFTEEEFPEQIVNWVVDLFNIEKNISDTSYCHGLAGQLELWRLIKCRRPQYAVMADLQINRIVQTMRYLQEKDGNRKVWASDDPLKITPDLWIGFLGPATALNMLINGNKESFISLKWLKANENENKNAWPNGGQSASADWHLVSPLAGR